jgi:hypothetical protein
MVFHLTWEISGNKELENKNQHRLRSKKIGAKMTPTFVRLVGQNADPSKSW